MSWRDKAKEAQGEQSAFPNFLKNVSFSFEMKKDDKGETTFSYWDRDKEERKFIKKPMEGVLIGEAMKLYQYSDNIGRNGGTVSSSIFFDYKDSGVAFSGGSITNKGRMKDIKQEILSEYGGCKTRRVLFVLTINGLYEIVTNIALAIFDKNQLEADILRSNMIKITPSTYNPDDPKYDAKLKKHIGKQAGTNKPRYAFIESSSEITDDMAEDLGLESVFDKYLEWKEFTTQANNEEIEGAEKSNTSEQEVTEINDNAPPISIDNAPPPEEDENDLPW